MTPKRNLRLIRRVQATGTGWEADGNVPTLCRPRNRESKTDELRFSWMATGYDMT